LDWLIARLSRVKRGRIGPPPLFAGCRVGRNGDVRTWCTIRRLNESFGGANTATGGYHETITAAYVTLLAQFLDRRQDGESLRNQTRRLLAGPLAAKDVLLSFYSRDRLMSVEARVAWREPDLTCLQLSAIVAFDTADTPLQVSS
jgi:hypothetical protein